MCLFFVCLVVALAFCFCLAFHGIRVRCRASQSSLWSRCCSTGALAAYSRVFLVLIVLTERASTIRASSSTKSHKRYVVVSVVFCWLVEGNYHNHVFCMFVALDCTCHSFVAWNQFPFVFALHYQDYNTQHRISRLWCCT